ncbi:L,D-transpeptidase family protein [Campylobacter sp. MG1]|uniref:L,D-transpeptidase family protein n=1 Tax=Campylobacter sp. MG1 TaxID=2976332 RepID=UPI00226C95D6|nr:L,D-transpeptidase family protein [Campylobacter sp. MG1]
MKKIIIFILSLNLYASSLLTNYLKEGIVTNDKKIEAKLSNIEFWKNELLNIDLEYGYYSDGQYIVVVDKDEQKIVLYELKNNKLLPRFEQSVITGLMGNKNVEGDLKTPVGAYEVTNKMVPPDNYYGPYAFVLSYPNLYDSLRKKTGSGIWIHGFPLEGDVRYDTYKTKGCVVMTNDVLLDFEAILKDKKAQVLINEKGITKTNADEISIILANLFDWKNTWTYSDIDKYLSYYNDDFIRYDGVKLKEFKQQKKTIFARKEDKKIKFSNINIIPYPNLDNEKIFKITFYENYSTQNYKFNGSKVLYIKLIDNKMSILVEK